MVAVAGVKRGALLHEATIHGYGLICLDLTALFRQEVNIFYTRASESQVQKVTRVCLRPLQLPLRKAFAASMISCVILLILSLEPRNCC